MTVHSDEEDGRHKYRAPLNPNGDKQFAIYDCTSCFCLCSRGPTARLLTMCKTHEQDVYLVMRDALGLFNPHTVGGARLVELGFEPAQLSYEPDWCATSYRINERNMTLLVMAWEAVTS